ncbi:hypothetical protein INR49_029903 [Caranx melampygus]|nr:hypothetical protein INR49_029903 [Caranx melampygus]
MISPEDDEELDETVEEYATDTTWSWVKSPPVNRILLYHSFPCMPGIGLQLLTSHVPPRWAVIGQKDHLTASL